MAREYFYNGTIKTIITCFGSIFDNITMVTDHDDIIKVPIMYSPREKFLAYFLEYGDLDALGISHAAPRLGFEMVGMMFSPERYSNPLGKIQTNNKFTYARVPYDFSFVLYLGTVKFEDSLKIIEQIVPFFTPELNLTIRDKSDLGLTTDVPVVLNSVSYTIEYEGSFEEKRSIQWQLQFTVKAWLYGNTNDRDLIKKTIVDLTDKDFDTRFAQLMSEVVPSTANKTDPHTINDTVVE